MAPLDQALDLLLDGPHGLGARPERLDAQLQSDLTTEVGRVDGGVVQVEGAHLIRVQVVAQAPQGGGLAAARLTGQQPQRFGVDEVSQARVQLVQSRGGKEVVFADLALEGQVRETESGGVHHDSSSGSS